MSGAGGFGIRWTVGDVSELGFEAVRLSIRGAARAFGPGTSLAVVVNSITVEEARRRTGAVPDGVEWLPAGCAPDFLNAFLGEEMAEGVAWKLAPLRLFPDRFELALDNDCILWDIPDAVKTWCGEDDPRCLIAADVRLAFGVFTDVTRPEPRNTGIRGMPPGYDLGAALAEVLRKHPFQLRSELDEQGLQAVALDLGRPISSRPRMSPSARPSGRSSHISGAPAPISSASMRVPFRGPIMAGPRANAWRRTGRSTGTSFAD